MFTQLSRLVGSARLRILAGSASLAMLGAAGILIARDPVPLVAPVSPPPATPKPVVPADVLLARSVLTALENDPLLKDVNIIVSVMDRGVVIGGPVPSEEAKKRVEVVVRGVPGIESVKNTCFVQADSDAFLQALAERLKLDAKAGDSPALPGVALAPTSPDGFLPPLAALPPSDLLATAKPTNTVVAQKPSLPVGPAVAVLGAPVAPAHTGTANAPSVPSVAPGSLTGSIAPAKPVDMRAAVTAVRQTDKRFARLLVELKPDGGLFVTGWSAKADDAWDFATELRKLSGVSRVTVDPNLVK